jgi:hypothetical protein
MSPNEALYWRSSLSKYEPSQISPMLNVGSSSEEYRTADCPQIDHYLIRPLQDRGIHVVHCDLKEAPGVDVVGDLSSDSVRQSIAKLQPRAALCNNLLEHVPDRKVICDSIAELLPVGGYLFVSVPSDYPYHPDPIDTGYRPKPQDIGKLFPYFELMEETTICYGNYAIQIAKKPWLLVRDAYLIFSGAVKPGRWRVLVENYRYFIRQFKVSCVVLKKSDPSN